MEKTHFLEFEDDPKYYADYIQFASEHDTNVVISKESEDNIKVRFEGSQKQINLLVSLTGHDDEDIIDGTIKVGELR